MPKTYYLLPTTGFISPRMYKNNTNNKKTGDKIRLEIELFFFWIHDCGENMHRSEFMSKNSSSQLDVG